MSKDKEEYTDLVLLLRRSTKIESLLETLGGEGGGIWEKADSISGELPSNLMDKIIKIGASRNDAVHGDLKVKNIEKITKECDQVIEMLENKIKIDRLKKEVNLKLNELNFFDKENEIELNSSLDKWINRLNIYNMNKHYNIKDINQLLNEENARFKELNKYAKEYVIKNKLKQFRTLGAISIILFIIYIFVGNLYD